MKGRGRNTFRILLCVLSVCVSGILSSVGVRASTLYESPYVSWTPDRYAWTVEEAISNAPLYYKLNGSVPAYWYPQGKKVETGIPSSLRALKEGEHYYSVERNGEVPIKCWQVDHSEGKCIHDCTVDYWHGIENKGPKNKNGTYSGEHCNRVYYSGWTAYCADCGGRLNTSIVYMSESAAESITSVDTNKGYYYVCPSCEHIENTMGVTPHECKAISFNQYRVVYDKNVRNLLEVGGFMEDSYHMYNNEDVYRGEKITPNGRLSKNVYTRIGYVFKGWNTKSDGSGRTFPDCDKILNLSIYDYNEEPKRGSVKLYAQWEKAESTLKIDLNGGGYNDPKLEAEGGTYDRLTGVVTVKKQYGETYHANPVYVIPPLGYTVSFDVNGGERISPLTRHQSFVGWTQVSTPTSPFLGRMKDNVYAFVGPNGATDRITANYKNLSITLPDARKEGYSFGGWYSDAACTVLVGFAGDEYTATKNITLYAKWVELVLDSQPNYVDNDGKGAVDLMWSQPDGKNKIYKVYIAKENGDFALISDAADGRQENFVNKKYVYKETYDSSYEKETYIIPHSGFYELSAGGAQGGGYEKKSGGKGGRVTAKFFLSEGEKLNIAVGGKGGTATDEASAVGGKGGYNGGTGSKYGSGGGATIIKSDRQGILIVAGGGGGASPAGNGGKGGATESNRADGKSAGQAGHAGGGGGYIGGSKGEQTTHSHTKECYEKEDLAYDFKQFKSCTFFSSEDMRNYGVDKTEDMCSASFGEITVGGHTYGDNANFIINIGDIDNIIPVKNNTDLTVPLYLHFWGDGDGLKDKAYLRVFDQDGKRIKNFKLADCYTKTENKGGDNANYYWIAQNAAIGTPYEFKVSLPEGTTGVYVTIYLATEHVENGGENEGAWVEAKVESLKFTGGEKKIIICGYKDGQVLSSKPAYGGSNYVNSVAVNVETDAAGVCSGNGYASIQSDTFGNFSELYLKGVPAPDGEGPEKISTDSDKLILKGEGNNVVVVSFRKPNDIGTGYRFQVESYEKDREDVLSVSNETKERLETGVVGYYYILDTAAENEVTAYNATNKGNMLLSVSRGTKEFTDTLKVELTEDVMYLHMAAVDGAGNMGPTSHIILRRDSIQGEVSTGPIRVSDRINDREYQSVYPKDDRTYYVRADGKTPFLLSFPSFLSGVATPDYQVDHQIFDVTTDVLHQRYSTRLPISSPISAEDETLEPIDFIREMTGDSILRDAMNTFAVRKQNATESDFSQAFTLPADYHGSTLSVIPVAGVTNNMEEVADGGEVVYSAWEDDITHGVALIADGEGPVINGMECLESAELMNRDGRKLTLNLSADDELSGVREFYVEVTNRDNSISQVFMAAEGVIRLEITEENPVFCGDFSVTAYAVDNVGNETTVSGGLREFALTATVERILAPHEPLFKRGESGILSVSVWGYADKVEVEFPETFVLQNPGLKQTWYYADLPQYKKEESLQFMVPLEGVTEEEYEITVRAYKNGRVLEEYPDLYIIGTESVTEELRTRLR